MEHLNLKKYLKKSVITGVGKSIIVTIVTLSLIPLIIQKIGIDNYGVVMLTLLFSSAASIIDLGISKAVTLLIGKSKNNLEKKEIISGALFINIALILIIAIFVLFLIYLDVSIFGDNFDKKEYSILILSLGFLVLIFTLLSQLLKSILEAYFLMHYINIGNMFSSTLLYVTLYIATFLTSDLKIFLIISTLPTLLLFIFYLWIVSSKLDLKIILINKPIFIKIGKVSLKFLNIGVINSLIMPVNKYVLVYITGSSTLAGVFDLGLKISQSANSLLNSLSTPLFGVFSNAKKIKDVYKVVKTTTYILFIAFIVGIITFYFINDFVAVILDKNNSKLIAKTSMLLLVGICFTSVSEPAYRALMGTYRLKEAFYLKLTIPIINIMLFFIFNNFEAIMRISMALSLTMFLGSIIMIGYYFKYKEI